MDRRSYLKSSLMIGGSLLLPPGVLALAGCSGTGRETELAGFDGRIMGTGYSVRLGSVSKLEVIDRDMVDRIHAVLQDVDTHMSTWRDDSELSRFNVSRDSDWQPLSDATTRVIAHAIQTSVASDGAFDVSVGPLVDLWGFGAGGSAESVPGVRAQTDAGALSGSKPERRAIRQTLAQVGHDAIDVDLDARAVRKRSESVQLDLSGIAKGHAVDRVSELLDAEGHDSYLVEIGGELRSRGRKPDGTAWRVAIERPEVGRRDVFKVIELEDRAIATSGDYRNFFDAGGQRYSHSIDPRTGRPVTHELASVSVVAESTMAADALSTALMVMGPDAGMAFAERHEVAAHMILKKGTALAERQSPAFDSLAT